MAWKLRSERPRWPHFKRQASAASQSANTSFSNNCIKSGNLMLQSWDLRRQKESVAARMVRDFDLDLHAMNLY